MCGIDPASKWLFTRASHRIPKSCGCHVYVYIHMYYARTRGCACTCIDVGMAEDYFRVVFVCSRARYAARGCAIFDFSPFPFRGHQSRMADIAKILNRSTRSDYFLSSVRLC